MSAFGMGVASSAVDMGFGLINNAVSGLINNAFYKRNLRLQSDAQKELIDYQNEYNSPSAQMQRLAEAGLNPNLVYGSQAPAGQSGNASAPSGSGFPGSYNSTDVAAAGAHIMQMEKDKSAADLNNSLSRKAEAEANYYNTLNGRYNEYIDVQIKEANARIDNLATQSDLNIANTAKAEAETILANAEAAFRAGQIDLLQFEKRKIVAETALLAEKKRTEIQEQKLKSQETKLKNEQTWIAIQTGKTAEYEAEIAKLQAQWERIYNSEPNQKLREARLKAELTATANELEIKGKKAVIWTNTVFGWLTGASSSALQGATAGMNAEKAKSIATAIK